MNWALVPKPFDDPGLFTVPARRLTSAVDKMILLIMWLLSLETTAKAPSGEIDTPMGSLNFALVPTPLTAPPELLVPANVSTKAVVIVIFLIK